jgi:hypothetical protein
VCCPPSPPSLCLPVPLDPFALAYLLARDPPTAAALLAALDEAQRYAQACAQARLPTRHGAAATPDALLTEWAWLIRAARELGG